MRVASRFWRRRHWLLAMGSMPWWPRLAGASVLAEPDGGLVWSERLARQALALLAVSDCLHDGAAMPAAMREQALDPLIRLALQTAVGDIRPG